MASTELEHITRVLRTYEWTDYRSTVAHKEAQIAEREHQVDWACSEKDRLTREAGVADKNRVDVQTQRDRELKKGGKVMRMEEEAKELEKVVIKLCTQAETKEGAIKDEEAAQEVSGRELSKVRPSSLLVACFNIG